MFSWSVEDRHPNDAGQQKIENERQAQNCFLYSISNQSTILQVDPSNWNLNLI